MAVLVTNAWKTFSEDVVKRFRVPGGKRMVMVGDWARERKIQSTISCCGCCPLYKAQSACLASAMGKLDRDSAFEPTQSDFEVSSSEMPREIIEWMTSGNFCLKVVDSQN